MQNLIEVNTVSKSFGSQVACNNVSLSIPSGALYGMLGPNGAGKTTLIRMMTTITRPDSGSIHYNGQTLSEEHAAKMGYMPEERGLYKKMSVMEQLLFFAELKGVTPRNARNRAEVWLKRLDMHSWAHKKLEELSKGMAQKVQFLCTVLHEPEFIILDEPFSGFDPVNADLVKELILEMNRNGATILFSTHRMDNVEELCSHICIINKGNKVLDGETGGLRRKMFQHEYQAGYLTPRDFSGKNIQPYSEEKTSDGRYIYHFKFENQDASSLLQLCAEMGGLIHFTESLPTMHQIFVSTVKEGESHA
jgi:ABC-2 type transport system ATP-binding protein